MNNCILCHPACSGGTLIFRELCNALGYVGLSEVSNGVPSRFRNIPYDPTAQLAVLGLLDRSSWESEVSRRILECIEIAQSARLGLILREHTHDLFFRKELSEIHKRPLSQFLEKVNSEVGCLIPLIFSVRNPLDSYLGLKARFPRECFYSFEEYLLRFQCMVEAFKVLREQYGLVAFLRYEDFIRDSEGEISRICDTLNLKMNSEESPRRVFVSGNSGRSGSVPTARKRRPFSLAFHKEVESSEILPNILETLGYPPVSESGMARSRPLYIINSGKKFVGRLWMGCGCRLRWISSRMQDYSRMP